MALNPMTVLLSTHARKVDKRGHKCTTVLLWYENVDTLVRTFTKQATGEEIIPTQSTQRAE